MGSVTAPVSYHSTFVQHLPYVKVGTVSYHSTFVQHLPYVKVVGTVSYHSTFVQHLPYVKVVGTVSYHSTSHRLDHYQSLRGTSKVEAVHSVLDRTITANSVGKRKLCYAIPWPKSIVGVDMKCGRCKKHFMTHDPSYVERYVEDEEDLL